jgi:hypothetical protein
VTYLGQDVSQVNVKTLYPPVLVLVKQTLRLDCLADTRSMQEMKEADKTHAVIFSLNVRTKMKSCVVYNTIYVLNSVLIPAIVFHFKKAYVIKKLILVPTKFKILKKASEHKFLMLCHYFIDVAVVDYAE